MHQLPYLFEGVRPVAIAGDDILYGLCIPPSPALRRRHTIALERDSLERHAPFADHAEDAHALFFHEVAVSRGVVLESKGRRRLFLPPAWSGTSSGRSAQRSTPKRSSVGERCPDIRRPGS